MSIAKNAENSHILRRQSSGSKGKLASTWPRAKRTTAVDTRASSAGSDRFRRGMCEGESAKVRERERAPTKRERVDLFVINYLTVAVWRCVDMLYFVI